MWVLLYFVLSNGYLEPHEMEFRQQATCETAHTALTQMKDVDIEGVCFWR